MAEVNGTTQGSQRIARFTPTPPISTAQLGTENPPSAPVGPGASTSVDDPGVSARPRDARTLHLVLAAMGVTAYQERVPLQLLDFAYRYTNSILGDALHLVSEGYLSGAGVPEKAGKHAATQDAQQVPLAAVRLATSSRLGYQFSGALPKETLLELAAERNRIRLPAVDKEMHFGVRLPHERFCLTGTSWEIPDEWDGEEGINEPDGEGELKQGLEHMDGQNGVHDEKEDEDMVDGAEDEEDAFDAVFGRTEADSDMKDEDEDGARID